jgi:hypothetical protein
MRIKLFAGLLCFCVKFCLAQTPVPLSETAIETQAELQVNNDGEEIVDPGQDYFLDLNAGDIAEILSSPILNAEQAQALISHRQKFGILIAVEELQVTGAFDTACLQRIKPFVYCGRPVVDEQFQFSALLSAARHEVLLRLRRRLRDNLGYSDDGNYPFYKGDPNHVMFRYRMRAGNYFSAGIVMEKDPGEVLFASYNGGRMDFFSWHVFVRPNRLIKTIYFGDYQFQFGQGLVAWNGLSLGKSPEVNQFFRRGMGFRPYASAGESGFNRGIACSISLRDWSIDVWSSYKKIDASLFPVDTGFQNFEVSSINESGLHRTFDEIRRRGLVANISSGLHLQWEKGRIRSEWTIHQQHFNFPLWPGDDPYEIYDADGKLFLSAGWAMRYLLNNATLYSEVAIDRQGDKAIVGGILLMPDPRWTLSLNIRDYGKSYQCIGCDGLREGSKTQNERGVLAGVSWQIRHQLRFQGYLDRFYFPWLRYTTSAPSEGREWLAQLTYVPARTTEAYVRVKEEVKMNDYFTNGYEVPKEVKKINVRANVQWMYTKNFEFQSRCEWTGLLQTAGSSNGLLFFQEVRYKPLGKPYSLAVRWSMFKTDSYDTRIYSYEQDMAGSFSLPAYSDQGSRYYVLVRYRLVKGLDVWLRYSRSNFLQNATSQEIDLPPQEEVKVQIRWQF